MNYSEINNIKLKPLENKYLQKISTTNKLPPIQYTKPPKTLLTNGKPSYPTEYYNKTPNTKITLEKYKNYNKIQDKRLLNSDKYQNKNYVRKGVFYVINQKYSNINLR